MNYVGLIVGLLLIGLFSWWFFTEPLPAYRAHSKSEADKKTRAKRLFEQLDEIWKGDEDFARRVDCAMDDVPNISSAPIWTYFFFGIAVGALPCWLAVAKDEDGKAYIGYATAVISGFSLCLIFGLLGVGAWLCGSLRRHNTDVDKAVKKLLEKSAAIRASKGQWNEEEINRLRQLSELYYGVFNCTDAQGFRLKALLLEEIAKEANLIRMARTVH